MFWTILFLLLHVPLVVCVCPMACICIGQSIDCSSRHLKTLHIVNSLQLHQENNLFPTTASNIDILNLAYNELEVFSTHLSESYPRLQNLDLSHNRITEIKSVQSIVLMKELLYLKLSFNPISSLGLSVDTVLYSQSLSALDISNCDISAITNSDALLYMLNLTSLNLSGNPIIMVDQLTSTSLTYLDLSQCLLGLNSKSISDSSFSQMTQLRFLNISFNTHLLNIPFLKLLSSSLKHLDASYCGLEKVNLKSFPNLSTAILKGNVIKSIDDDMLNNNVYLKTLDLSKNSISNVDKYAFMGTNSLRELDLSMNMLTNLNWNSFSNTSQLEVLNISRNSFTSLYQIPIASLVTLDASHCDILKLGPSFLAKAKKIMFFNLSHNSIEKLPKRLSGSKLTNLDISFCRLTELNDETFGELTSLISLNLIGNRLTNPVRKSLLDKLVNLQVLSLINNPWLCNCRDADYRNLWKYLTSHSGQAAQLKVMTCHYPKEVNGLSWDDSCSNVVSKTESSYNTSGWFSFLVPFLTLICLLAILIVIRQAYTAHELALQNRESHDNSVNRPHRGTSALRDVQSINNINLEQGIQMSLNDSGQRSPIHDLSKLPSYEEALLLPKPDDRDDMRSIVQRYEDSGRFVSPGAETLQTQNNVAEVSVNSSSTD